MPAERPIQLPEPRKSGQSYVMSQAFYDKLKEADLGNKIIPNAEDFDIEKGAGELKFKLKTRGGASLKYVINRLNVDAEGKVIMTPLHQWIRYFENGRLKWQWSSEGATGPEPEVPAGTPVFFSVELTAL